MIVVEGLTIGENLVYACPVCTDMHTHSSVPGETLANRVSHCPVSEDNVNIKVETLKPSMEDKPQKKTNAQYALEYYHRKKEEILKKKLLARMENGYVPKISTLRKYEIPIPSV